MFTCGEKEKLLSCLILQLEYSFQNSFTDSKQSSQSQVEILHFVRFANKLILRKTMIMSLKRRYTYIVFLLWSNQLSWPEFKQGLYDPSVLFENGQQRLDHDDEEWNDDHPSGVAEGGGDGGGWRAAAALGNCGAVGSCMDRNTSHESRFTAADSYTFVSSL